MIVEQRSTKSFQTSAVLYDAHCNKSQQIIGQEICMRGDDVTLVAILRDERKL